MVREVEDQRVALEELCRRFQVRRLELFGSASGEGFNPQSSDLDFLVEFEDPPASGYADAYFGLAESLRELFHRDIDLVVLSAIRNPYFLESIERSRTLLYAA
ncbi:MAG TPA: nucleotidyltransferase domain-containing protein [Candidatus Polarisedimenticolaceae bacterium]|nr:nucleotidyltransferase domain-containing protein [Candidatus Polarisedimenticolaceae bacterium]